MTRRGTGLTTYETVSIENTPENAELIFNSISSMPSLSALIRRDERLMARWLERLGFGEIVARQRTAIVKAYGEDSFEDLSAEFVVTARAMRAEQERIREGNGSWETYESLAAGCGRLRERIFWKCGVVDDTGLSAEALAIRAAQLRARQASSGRSRRRSDSDQIAALMDRLTAQGHGPAKAARIVMDKHHLGKSPQANEAIWRRRRAKAVSGPSSKKPRRS